MAEAVEIKTKGVSGVKTAVREDSGINHIVLIHFTELSIIVHFNYIR